jgi:hypothetical protein
MGTGSFPGVKNGRDVTLTPHSLLVPWSRKSRAIPLLLLLAVRPAQSLSICIRNTLTKPSLRRKHQNFVLFKFVQRKLQAWYRYVYTLRITGDKNLTETLKGKYNSVNTSMRDI